jgi:hypothetical protein
MRDLRHLFAVMGFLALKQPIPKNLEHHSRPTYSGNEGCYYCPPIHACSG